MKIDLATLTFTRRQLRFHSWHVSKFQVIKELVKVTHLEVLSAIRALG